MKFLETLEPAKTSKQNIIVIIPTCHYTYSAIFTSSIWNYFDTNFLVSFKCFDIFLDRNPSKCWTLKEETWQGLNTRYSHFATGQTVFRVLFRCMGMMISGHHTSFTSNLFWNYGFNSSLCFFCWGNLRISGLLQVLAEVENTSTAIQRSLQTQVEEEKAWITLNVDRRSKKRERICPRINVRIMFTILSPQLYCFEQIYTSLPKNLLHLVCWSCLSHPLHNPQNTRHGKKFQGNNRSTHF